MGYNAGLDLAECDSMRQHNDTARMGKIMIAIGFVIGLGLLTLFFDDRLQQQRNPNRDPASTVHDSGLIEVFLERNRQGHYVMTGTINRQDVDFILDTGATDVVVPNGVAQAAGLLPGQQRQAMTANGLVNIYSTTIDTLRLGDITLHDVRASINPAMDEGIILLGMSALRQIEFSQQGDQLTLRHYPGSY